MTKLALMPAAAFGMPSLGEMLPPVVPMPVFAGAHCIREAHVVTSPVTTGHVSGISAAADAHVAYVAAWDNRQAKSAKWTRPPRDLTP